MNIKTLALISPSAPSPPETLAHGKALLEARGFTVKMMPHVAHSDHEYLAGSDADRLADLHAAYADPEVDAILCARGGFGATRLLPGIDFELIHRNPKLLMGFSDITALHMAIYKETGQIGYYSPMLTSNLAEPDQDWTWAQWLRLLGPDATTAPLEIPNIDPYTCFTPGTAEGKLMGGNLSLLTALCGTRWQPDFTSAVVFIEDWKERFYSLDRQFTQLKQAGLLGPHIAGLLLCDFSQCPEEHAYSIGDQLQWLTADLGVPVGYGFTVGHGDQTATIPIGVRARFEAQPGRLTLLESPLQVRR